MKKSPHRHVARRRAKRIRLASKMAAWRAARAQMISAVEAAPPGIARSLAESAMQMKGIVAMDVLAGFVDPRE